MGVACAAEGEGLGTESVAGDHGGGRERPNGDDQESAAPPGMVMPAVTTPALMPTSASRGISHHMALK